MIIKAINTRLEGSSELQAIVGDRIFPLDIPQNEEAPAIAFNAVDTPRDSRSGNYDDENEAQIFVVSKEYSELADLITIIRSLFHIKNWNDTGISVSRSIVTNVTRQKNAKYNEYQAIISVNIKSKIE